MSVAVLGAAILGALGALLVSLASVRHLLKILVGRHRDPPFLCGEIDLVRTLSGGTIGPEREISSYRRCACGKLFVSERRARCRDCSGEPAIVGRQSRLPSAAGSTVVPILSTRRRRAVA